MNIIKKAKKSLQGKGKGVATSSSQPSKRRRQLVLEREDSEEESPPQQQEEEMELDDDSTEKPDWRVGTSLHTLPYEWQLLLYKDKMCEVDSLKKQLICERKVVLDDFRGFGLVESFERMGWRQGLIWNAKNSPEIYLDGIIEWMGSMKRVDGTNPPETMSLVGTVNNKKVTMSFATLDKIAKFDHGSTIDRNTDYLPDGILMGGTKGDNWVAMVSELFTYTPEVINMNVKLERKHLKPLPRLLMSVLSWNVTPRSSDKAMIRYNEVVVLYALVTGNLKLSLRQIIMLNIWEARNRKNKTSLPHARLITNLIRIHKAIPTNIALTSIAQVPLTMARLLIGSEWRLEETPQARILREARGAGYLIAPKDGYDREEVRQAMEGGGDEGGDEGGDVGGDLGDSGRRDTSLLGMMGVNFERPEHYQNWTPYEQNMWDLTQARFQEQRRYERGMAYAHELDIRRRFNYEETVRHHHDYVEGRAYVEVPPQYDYRALDPFTRGVDIAPHYPQSYDSDWLPRHSSAARLGEGSSSAPPPPEDPFETRSMYTGLMESLFGPRQE